MVTAIASSQLMILYFQCIVALCDNLVAILAVHDFKRILALPRQVCKANTFVQDLEPRLAQSNLGNLRPRIALPE
jgi:hypothetical protein